MKPDRWRQVDALYEAALERTAEERAAFLWLIYIALEPYVRRRTPHRIVSWTRLLAGAVRDPLVGRDLLIGILLGVLTNLIIWFSDIAGNWLNVPHHLRAIRLETLLGTGGIVPQFIGSQPVLALVHGLGYVFLLLLLSLILRSERRAAVGLWLLFFVAFIFSSVHPLELFFSSLLAAAYIFVSSRFGLLAVTVAQFAPFMIEFYPYTNDFAAWYSGVTIFALAVVTALAAYGFHTSLAGQPLVRGALLDN